MAMKSPTSVEMMILIGSPPPKTVSIPKAIIARPKYSGGPKRRANLARAGAKAISRTTESVPAIQEPIAAMERAAPGPPLFGHLIAVEAGHDRRGFPGNVDQNRCDRTAVGHPVVDPGKQDDRRGGVDREGEREQQGDRGGRPDPRQDPDELTDEATGQAVKEVFPGQGDGKTHHQIIPEFHRLRPFYQPIRPIGRGMSSHVAEDDMDEDGRSPRPSDRTSLSCASR